MHGAGLRLRFEFLYAYGNGDRRDDGMHYMAQQPVVRDDTDGEAGWVR